MASVVNERDKLMRQSAQRVVSVQPTEQIVVEGYTGLKVVSDNGYWASGGSMYPYHVVPNGMYKGQDKESIAVVLTGIPGNTPITWKCGTGTIHWDASKGEWIQDTFIEKPFGYGDPNVYTGIILTPTPDPLVVTVNAASYPKTTPLPPNGSLYNWGGAVRASVVWGGKEFWMFKMISIGM